MLDRVRLTDLVEREQAAFVAAHPKSRALAERAGRCLLGGVPMNWMVRWPGAFPVFVAEASGSRFVDVDGLEYVDLCLGDTGAMTGHAPPAAVRAVAEQAARGVTLMLPTADAIEVGDELSRRFGVPWWQFTLTATDANRFAIRLARMITGRPRILVFNGCYHGTVDETVVSLDERGTAVPRSGSVGPPVDPALTTRVVEFNDVDALDDALGQGDVACVLAEPAMTNIGIILPEPGFHDALRTSSRRHGTLLILDETHTICAGPGGMIARDGLEPDVVTIGKPLGSGVPSGAYGVSREVGEEILARTERDLADVGGIGGTLAANALSLAAMRATLTEVLTPDAFPHMIAMAERFEAGVQRVIVDHGLPWHVTRLGCRAEYRFQPTMPRDGGEAARGEDPALDAFLHLWCLNRGVLLTPFHNMALMSPATTAGDVDLHTEVLADAVEALFG